MQDLPRGRISKKQCGSSLVVLLMLLKLLPLLPLLLQQLVLQLQLLPLQVQLLLLLLLLRVLPSSLFVCSRFRKSCRRRRRR